MENLKQYIKNNLLTKMGGINAAILRRDHFIKSAIALEIKQKTAFLDVYSPVMGERIKAILNDITELTYCSCGKLTLLFSPTCGNKECRNISIKKCKQEVLTTDPLSDNDDIVNKEVYIKILKANKIDFLKSYVLTFINTELIKSNGHLNIERISSLNNTNKDMCKRICILTYFCNNYKELTLLNRIKMILLDKNDIEYCSCGKLNQISGERYKIFTSSCGNPDCYYKIVTNAFRDNKELIQEKRLNTLSTNKEIFKDELSMFLNSLNTFSAIDYDIFRNNIIELYKDRTRNYNIFGTNITYLQFKNNETLIKNLIYYTPYIDADINSLNIFQRVYNIVNDIKEIPMCKTCGKIKCNFISHTVGYTTYCINCRCCESVSKLETEVYDYVISLHIIAEHGNRSIISPLELDIIIPDKKIAIEFDGNYWHSDLNGKDQNYHLNKTIECNKQSYRLIHIFEDEWIKQQKIVKARLRNILGVTKYKIYARKCEIKDISNDVKNTFLEKYHIQGKDVSSTRLGLFYKNRLVAVMTFGKRRFDDKEGFELIRYSTIANFNIVGGAGKLLAYFRKTYNIENLPIISYADRRWSQGNLYKQLGFALIRESAPSYFYIDSSDVLTRHTRFEFQKHKLKDKLHIFDEQLTENENMRNNGYARIFDCGTLVYELK